MPEETIDVAPSEDNGNVPQEISEDAPSEQPIETETPAEIVEEPTSTEPELYELPDGRKVDGEAVAQEYRNLLSDYTRKSQELAAVKAPITETKPTNPLQDPEYIPSDYKTYAQQIKEDTLRELEEREQAREQARQALEDSVVTQLTEIKEIDPTLNENALFSHATKYRFTDLKLAHQNMRDMNEMAKKVQTATVANIAKRNDPVSVSPGATGTKLDPNAFGSAVEYLRALKGQ